MIQKETNGLLKTCLNPCCNGIYLMINKEVCEHWTKVLILVVMEYT